MKIKVRILLLIIFFIFVGFLKNSPNSWENLFCFTLISFLLLFLWVFVEVNFGKFSKMIWIYLIDLALIDWMGWLNCSLQIYFFKEFKVYFRLFLIVLGEILQFYSFPTIPSPTPHLPISIWSFPPLFSFSYQQLII